MTTAFSSILSRWRWSGLLTTLLVAMFFSTAAGDSTPNQVVTMVLYALVFAGTLHAAHMAPLFRYVGIALVALWILVALSAAFGLGSYLGMLFTLLTTCIILGCLVVTISELAHNREAGLDPILGAVFGYFLIGVTWSLLYGQIEIEVPGSFNLPSDRPTPSEFVYFSLVTMTTLGYGDISPAGPIPRLLAGIQAVVGTIYIAVFVGRIVGRFKE
ncbi:MAG: potassium channel family protein [Pseudomonadota bacterium]